MGLATRMRGGVDILGVERNVIFFDSSLPSSLILHRDICVEIVTYHRETLRLS
jgi:hypothetical protein